MKTITKYIHLLILIMISTNSYSSDKFERDPTIGGIEFERSCAICHGFNGKGKGVMSDSLTKKPADLTVLSKNNNGQFPFDVLYETIEGTPKTGAHGTRDMPLWGERYRKEARDYNELFKKYSEITQQPEVNEYLYSRGLILDLLIYIRSIQE